MLRVLIYLWVPPPWRCSVTVSQDPCHSGIVLLCYSVTTCSSGRKSVRWSQSDWLIRHSVTVCTDVTLRHSATEPLCTVTVHCHSVTLCTDVTRSVQFCALSHRSEINLRETAKKYRNVTLHAATSHCKTNFLCPVTSHNLCSCCNLCIWWTNGKICFNKYVTEMHI